MALAVALLSAGVFSVKAQDIKKEMDDKYVENDVVSLAGKKGFSFSTKAGDFLFKPYALVQASACYNRYDDQGLESHYAKSVANSGFAIPNAILGFTGKAFGRVTFNLSLNAAKSGGALLQQAWFDVAIKESFRIRVGKFIGGDVVSGTALFRFPIRIASLRRELCHTEYVHGIRLGCTGTWFDQ